MAICRTFCAVMLAAFVSPAVVAANDFETTELMALPDEIRRDVYLYIIRNVESITNPSTARLVQWTRGPKYFAVRLKYGGPAAATEDGPGLWVTCTYAEGTRVRCWTRYQAPKGKATVDPPLPELQQPLIPDETRSNNPLEDDG